jgi:hypothetical protein
LGGRDDLWGSTINVMDRSRWLIVVLSRRAAASEWVDKEVAYWLQHRGPDHLMLVVAEGHLQWDEQNRRLDPHGSDVALPVLTEPWAYPSEPFYIDVSQDAPWDIKAPTFRDKVSHLAAPIHGKSKYELASDDVREQRGSRRLRLAVLVTLVVLTIVSLTVAVVAVRQAQELLRLRNHAEARHLVSEGGSELIGLHDNVWTQQEGASMDALKGRSVDSGVHRIVSSDSSRWAPASRRAGIPNFPAGTSTATAADWPPSAVYDLKLLGGKSF